MNKKTGSCFEPVSTQKTPNSNTDTTYEVSPRPLPTAALKTYPFRHNSRLLWLMPFRYTPSARC